VSGFTLRVSIILMETIKDLYISVQERQWQGFLSILPRATLRGPWEGWFDLAARSALAK
jgi:hypothetical protein